MLGKVASENQKNWDEYLPLVMAAYRASPHEATGLTPNRLILGRETEMPVDVVLGRPEEQRPEFTSYDEFTDDLAARMETAFQFARKGLNKAAERRKKSYDLRVRGKDFAPGQWVWYYNPRRYKGRSPKWQRHYTGPYLIVKSIPPVNFVIQRTKNSVPQVVHADKLKLWGGEPLPSWLDRTEGDEESENAVTEPVVSAEADGKAGRKQREQGQRPVLGQRGDELSNVSEDSDTSQVRPKRPARTKKPPGRLAEYVR